MLILERRKGEAINVWIDGRVAIQIVVNELRGDRVRLGFQADKSIKIVREELGDPDGRDYG